MLEGKRFKIELLKECNAYYNGHYAEYEFQWFEV